MTEAKKDDSKSKIIETTDENGNVVKFELVDMLKLDGKEYVLLLKIDEAKEDNSENAVIMRLAEKDDGYIFERIDDDSEFEKIKDYIEKLKQSINRLR